ncbi:MAG: six-hairpin glycosidase, partial [Duncaniella sp.]|nr:six-hairpin glycosidase [Duncaniella sp.]
PGKAYHVKVDLDLDNRNSTVYVDGEKKATRMLFAPVEAVERVVFRTGTHSSFPNVDTPADQYNDTPRANDVDAEAVYRIANVKSSSHDIDGQASLLRYDNFAHYPEYFNDMEDENIVQAIPNAESSKWMKENVPLFECPDKDMEEMYYYRWWSLRKHIKDTPVGYGMTEFLVNRSYADKYNLIACAIGHHIYESRWLRDPKYLDGIINTWYHGNDGQPMEKMMKFSSWNPDAVYNRYLVDGDLAKLEKMYPDLKAEYARWEESHRLPNGLYWQGDVQDGMEESISGGRRKKYARPTINSYMYGNAKALAAIAEKLGKTDDKALYEAKAKEMKDLVQNRLWNVDSEFFETVRGDTCARVREAIGYIPWYFNLPDDGKYDNAWLQINDEKGFSAPYGLTTAERRHPEFRSHGVGQCEWD